jgi:hypothetical protein
MPNDVLLADADVLIDYIKTDLSIIRLVSQHCGQVYVLEQVRETVEGLTKSLCRTNQIQVIDAETDLLIVAGTRSGSGPLSFEDWLCYLVCQEQNWICVTNDQRLIRECDASDVRYRRGLRLILDLVDGRHVTKQQAVRIAQAIGEVNPRHINAKVLQEFMVELSP